MAGKPAAGAARTAGLGTVRIDGIAPDAAVSDKATMFRPRNVRGDIKVADAGVRQAAYPLSFERPQ